MLSPHRRPRPSLEIPKTPLSILTHPEPHEGEGQEEEEEEEPTVLPSSTELFYFYGQSLEQCEMKLGRGKVMWELGRVWGRWLRVYAGGVLFSFFSLPTFSLSSHFFLGSFLLFLVRNSD
jgi:hypothetical protein